nr:MAG TPA: PKD-like domain [Caudoviricetes sp.]
MTPVSLICLAQSPDGGELTYQWYSKENLIENANKNEYTANEEGSYSVIVTNHLNNSIMTT